MALLTIRQKQSFIGYAVVSLVVIGLVSAPFVYFPLVAWPVTAVLLGLLVWWYVRRVRRIKRAHNRPAIAKPRPTTLDVSVPFGPEDTADSIALKLIDAANARGQRVSVAEARRVAEAELRKARGETA